MHDHDDIDFAMLDLPTRPGPAKATTAPEQDPVERRLEREVEAAEHIAAAAEAKALERGALPCNALSIRNQVRQREISKALAADVCCPDCGHETGYHGRCMSCDWHTSHNWHASHGQRIVSDLPCIDGEGAKASVSVDALGGGTFRLTIADQQHVARFAVAMGIEVKHGSGKVRV